MPHPFRINIANKKTCIKSINPPAAEFITEATNGAAPRLSVIAFRVHANVRIRIAGTIALNPSGMQAIESEKRRTFLTA